MESKKNIVAIIPARGGSKSIPRKNIKYLGGCPLISYSIAAGLSSEYIDRVIVSTDDEEIAEVALYWGAEVPFIRPAELAEDHVLDLPVFDHAIHWLESNEKYRPNIVVQLRPTTPFRPTHCVDEAIELLLRSKADSVRGVTPSGQNPYKMWHVKDDRLVPIMTTEFREPYNMPRQKLPATFWQTGHVEAIRYETIMHKHSLTGDAIAPLIIAPEYAIDLDNEFQWEFAEYVLEHMDLDIIHPNELFLDHRKLGSSIARPA